MTGEFSVLLHDQLIRSQHHNRQLRKTLIGAAAYGAFATLAALVGWLR